MKRLRNSPLELTAWIQSSTEAQALTELNLIRLTWSNQFSYNQVEGLGNIPNAYEITDYGRRNLRAHYSLLWVEIRSWAALVIACLALIVSLIAI